MSTERISIKAAYKNNILYYCFTDLKTATYHCTSSSTKRGITYYNKDYHLHWKRRDGTYITGMALFQYITHDHCRISSEVYDLLVSDFTVKDIINKIFKIVYINSQETEGTEISSLNSASPRVLTYDNITEEYKAQAKEDKIELQKGFKDSLSIEHFLRGPVFQACEGEINMYEHFRAVSVSHKELFLKKSPNRGFGRKSVLDMKASTAKERTRQALSGFQKLCDLSGQKLQWYLQVWFKHRPDDLLYFVKKFIETKSSAFKLIRDELRSAQGKHFITGVPKADFMAFIKDRLNMSSRMMSELRLWPDLDDVLPNRSALDNVVEHYNTKAWNTMKTEYQNEGFCCSVEPLVEYIIQSHLKEQKERKDVGLPYVENMNDTLLFKLTMDARTIGDLSSTVLCLVPLNVATFKPQSRESYFPVAIWYGKESGISSFSRRIGRDLALLQQKTLRCEERDHRCKFFWTSDLAAMQYVCPDLKKFHMFCPYCTKTVDSVFDLNASGERLIDNDLNIGETIFCVMHMIERITEYLLLRSVDHEERKIIETRLRTLSNFSTFHVTKEEYEKEHPDECTWSKLYLSGRQCTTLLANYNMVLNGCPKAVLEIWKIWKKIVYIIVKDYSGLKSKDLQLKRDKERLLREKAKSKLLNETIPVHNGIIEYLSDLIKLFGKQIVERYIGTNKTSYYIHILYHHVPELLERLMERKQSLSLFANQGFESSHSYDQFIEERHCARATRRELDDETNFYNSILGNRSGLSDENWKKWLGGFKLLQLVLYKHRVLIMSTDVENATWNRKLRKIKQIHKEEYDEFNISANFNFEYDFSFEDSVDPDDFLYTEAVDEHSEDIEEEWEDEELDIEDNEVETELESSLLPDLNIGFEEDTHNVDCDQQESIRQRTKVIPVHFSDNTLVSQDILYNWTPGCIIFKGSSIIGTTKERELDVLLDTLSIPDYSSPASSDMTHTPTGFSSIPSGNCTVQVLPEYNIPIEITAPQVNMRSLKRKSNIDRDFLKRKKVNIQESSLSVSSDGSIDDVEATLPVVFQSNINNNECLNRLLGRNRDDFTTLLDRHEGRLVVSQLKIIYPGISKHRLSVIKNEGICEVTNMKGWVCSDMIFAYISLLIKAYSVDASVLNPEAYMDLEASVKNGSGTVTDAVRVACLSKVIFYPYNTGSHWILAVFDLNQRIGLFFDSYGSNESFKLFLHHQNMLVNHILCPTSLATVKKWFNITSGHVFQKDISSCGIFTMLFAELLLVGYTPYEIIMEALRSFKDQMKSPSVLQVRKCMANRLEYYSEAGCD